MNKKNIGIIFGGVSTEHEISLRSSQNIIKYIDKEKFEVILISIDKSGRWYIHDEKNLFSQYNDSYKIEFNNNMREIILLLGYRDHQFIYANQVNKSFKIDVMFSTIHGLNGEDGCLQGLLRIANNNIAYVGSDVLGAAISMDKDITKRLLRDAGIAIVPFISFKKNQYKSIKFNEIIQLLGLPLFIKPTNQGSSIGISKVANKKEFEQGLELAFFFDNKIIIERAIKGQEIECAILGNENPKVSVCGEIMITGDSFYSYNTKYINTTKSQIVIPANISKYHSDNIRHIALKTFTTLNCVGMARVDVFLTHENDDDNQKILVNEINTIPGFTENSMYMKLWQKSGLSYTNILTRLIELAIEYFKNKKIIDCMTKDFKIY